MTELPFNRFIQVGMGMLQLSPTEFWNLSLHELYLAIDGFQEFHGSNQKDGPLTREELNELMELYPD